MPEMARHVSSCGDHAAYTAGCKPCQAQARAYAYSRHWGIYGGTWDRMVEGDALERVKDAVRALLAHPGVTVPGIAAAAGIGHTNVYRLMNGGTTMMRPDVAQALLSVTPERVLAARETRHVDITGTARRLRALAADGWSSEALAPLCGVNAVTIGHWRAALRTQIRIEGREKIRALYEKIQSLADPRGPSPMAARRAHEFGYLPPERWADEDIDDPDAEPLPPPPETDDHVAVSRQIEGVLRDPRPGAAADFPRPVKAEIARHAHVRLGWSYERIAELLGFRSTNAVGYMLKGRKDRPRTQRGSR